MAVRASCLDEMQLACDPSDPSLQFRVSAHQINEWIAASATRGGGAKARAGAAAGSKAAALPAPPVTTATAPSDLAAVACAVRRLRHFVCAFEGAISVDDGAVGADHHHSHHHHNHQGGAPSKLGAGGAARKDLAAPAAATQQRATVERRTVDVLRQRLSGIPSHTPLVDVEIARVAALLSGTASGLTAPGLVLASRLHRQLLRSVRAHPLSTSIVAAAQAGRTAATARPARLARLRLVDAVHGHRIRVPVRSEFCRAADHGPVCLLSYVLLALQAQGAAGAAAVSGNTGGGGSAHTTAATGALAESDLASGASAFGSDTDVFALCALCQAPVTPGSLYIDCLAERVLSVLATTGADVGERISVVDVDATDYPMVLITPLEVLDAPAPEFAAGPGDAGSPGAGPLSHRGSVGPGCALPMDEMSVSRRRQREAADASLGAAAHHSRLRGQPL